MKYLHWIKKNFVFCLVIAFFTLMVVGQWRARHQPNPPWTCTPAGVDGSQECN